MSNTEKPTPLTSQEKELFDLLQKRDVPALRNFFEREVSKFFFDINCQYNRDNTQVSNVGCNAGGELFYTHYRTWRHHGLTALTIVTLMQDYDENSQMEMMTLLVENGADINRQITVDNKNFWTGNVNYVSGMTIDNKSFWTGNVKYVSGMTALHLAFLRGLYNLTKLLLHHGADPNIVDEGGESPLFYAIKCESCPSDVIKELLDHGASPHIVNACFLTPWHYAFQFRRFGVMKMILENGDVDAPLMIDTLMKGFDESSQIAMMALLLDNGADINRQITIHNKTFLTGNVNYVLGMTALHLACLGGSYCLTKLLLHHGANPNIVDHSGDSPLLYATKRQHCSSDFIKELLHYGASPHIADAAFRTPLHYACQFQRFDVMKMILEYGGVDVNMQDNWGRTPLNDLCLSNYAADLIPFIQLLLTYGANINIPDTYGATALMNSFLLEEKPISEQKLGMIRCILNAEADVMNAMTDDTNVHGVPMVVGDTPLHVVVKKGNAPLVRLLMEFYPTLTKRNRHYETALDVGRNMGETLIVCMLESEQRQRFYKNLGRYWIKQQYHPKTVLDTTRGNPTS